MSTDLHDDVVARPTHAARTDGPTPDAPRVPAAPVTVLMSTYAGEVPDHLDQALASLFGQRTPPEQCVLVVDGPVPDALEAVLARWEAAASRIDLVLIRLPENRGLAEALRAGMQKCGCQYVMRMDADDIMAPDRVARQWDALSRDPSVDVLASWHAEFEDAPDRVLRFKRTPERHEEIARALRWRCVISHPTIVFRKIAVERVGGYRAKYGFLEDHDLYMRLLKDGARFAAVQEPLVKVRVSRAQLARRGGARYVANEWRFRYDCLRQGLLTPLEFLMGSCIYTAFRMLPVSLKPLAYRVVRRALARPDVPSGRQS